MIQPNSPTPNPGWNSLPAQAALWLLSLSAFAGSAAALPAPPGNSGPVACVPRQEIPDSPGGKDSRYEWGPEQAAATVNGFVIRAVAVSRSLRLAQPDDRAESFQPTPQLLAASLEHLVCQRIVFDALQSGSDGLGPSLVKQELDRFAVRLKTAGMSLEQHLQEQGLTAAELEASLVWNRIWQAFLDRSLTEPAMQDFFSGHLRDFDGTVLSVDQILWTWPAACTAETRQAMRDHAAGVHRQIQDGVLAWEDAVRQHSMSPLAKGDPAGAVRWIGRTGPMPEAFTAAAFRLESGQVSAPVETPFGLHIIRCIEVRPGHRKFSEVSGEVKQAMTSALFGQLVAKHRPGARVEYSPEFPHLRSDGGLEFPEPKRN